MEKNYSIAIPALTEQHVISAFLDHETVKIDALIEEQQRLIELLKEKRQAVISHAITRGLNLLLDISSFLLAMLFPTSDFWPAHVFRILYFSRIADYSSLRRGRTWSVFNADLPRVQSELHDRRDLTLFSAYRILGRVWLATCSIAVFCCLFTPALTVHVIDNNLNRIAIVIWALLIFSSHLPKRMLLWRGEAH